MTVLAIGCAQGLRSRFIQPFTGQEEICDGLSHGVPVFSDRTLVVQRQAEVPILSGTGKNARDNFSQLPPSFGPIFTNKVASLDPSQEGIGVPIPLWNIRILETSFFFFEGLGAPRPRVPSSSELEGSSSGSPPSRPDFLGGGFAGSRPFFLLPFPFFPPSSESLESSPGSGSPEFFELGPVDRRKVLWEGFVQTSGTDRYFKCRYSRAEEDT
ncbi:hypothetical protein DFH08DRAFT_813361 [Mycena albidolilacea]|uniref:Uncharacterized protein n=1 Tax=Mycena albidolilacea TaxID=1033008 RepID=A0AAD7EMD1_9AGAR|nr:hypothetical protein DFH08DRAFT_813361 [Mycena albidolilacea]